MTTIAFDGITLAADSQASADMSKARHQRFDLDTHKPINESYRTVRKLQVGNGRSKFRDSVIVATTGAGKMPTIEV